LNGLKEIRLMNCKTLFLKLTACGLGTLFWATCSNFLIEYSTENYLYDKLADLPEKDAALVLGAGKNGKYGINPYFAYRMEAAAELYFSGKVKKLIVSGDNHIKSYDETTDMAEYLVALGVPDHAIIRDYAGFRTLDSVVRAQKVFHCNSLIIVSQKFHNQRAVFIAHHYGIDAVAYNARDVQSKGNLAHLREFAAKFAAMLDLYLLNRQPKFL
jgi:SanA protein